MSAYFLVGAMFQAFVFWRFRLEGGTLRFRPEAATRTAGGGSHRMLVIPVTEPGGRHMLGFVGGCVALWA